jgi:hypothetical protein
MESKVQECWQVNFQDFIICMRKKVCTSCWKLIVFSTNIAEFDIYIENFNVDKNFERVIQWVSRIYTVVSEPIILSQLLPN